MSYFLRIAADVNGNIKRSYGSMTYSFKVQRPCSQQLPPIYFFPGQPDVREGQYKFTVLA
jgi:hypothetical protein